MRARVLDNLLVLLACKPLEQTLQAKKGPAEALLARFAGRPLPVHRASSPYHGLPAHQEEMEGERVKRRNGLKGKNSETGERESEHCETKGGFAHENTEIRATRARQHF